MSALDVDVYYALAQASPMLDAVEVELRDAGKADKAAALNKLQQDAAVDFERHMVGGDNLDTPAGPDTAVIMSAHAEVTPSRLYSVLHDSYAALSPGKNRDSLQEFMGQLPAAPAPAAAPAPKKAI